MFAMHQELGYGCQINPGASKKKALYKEKPEVIIRNILILSLLKILYVKSLADVKNVEVNCLVCAHIFECLAIRKQHYLRRIRM